jgi:predicted porin
MKNLSLALIALAVSGLAQAQTAPTSAYTIYGLIDASVGKSVDDSSLGKNVDFHSGGDNGSGEGNSVTRIGIKGSAALDNSVKANFKFETGGITSKGEVNPGGAFFNRAAWFGLSGNFGEVRFGRQDALAFQTAAPFDFNGASNGVSAWAWSGVAPWLRGRQNRSLQYLSPDFGGFGAQFGIVPKGNEAGNKATYSAALKFSGGPFAAAANVETKRTDGGKGFWSLVGSYDLSVVKFALSYANQGKASDGGGGKGVGFGVTVPIGTWSVGAIAGWNQDTKGKAYEAFVNKEIFKNTYAYAEAGAANSSAMLANGIVRADKTIHKGVGYATGVIFVF